MEKTQIVQELSKLINPENMKIDEPMKKHTSFHIGGNADIFIKAKSKEEIKQVVQLAKEKNVPLTIVGNGTNLLVRDKGIRGIVLKPEIQNIEINGDVILAGAGNTLAEIAFKAYQANLSGFEFAGGIPGSIGGAIKMNAGAHGREMKDVVVETTCLDPNLEEVVLQNSEQGFAYRTSHFFDQFQEYIVLGTKLKLEPGHGEEIKGKMDEYTAYRKEKQPQYPSAGSTFKRGKDFLTAKLIDEAGLKGLSVGGAEVSTLHAGFIINKGEATASDVLELVQQVKRTIQEKFQKTIELEVQLIGEE